MGKHVDHFTRRYAETRARLIREGIIDPSGAFRSKMAAKMDGLRSDMGMPGFYTADDNREEGASPP